MSKLPDPNLPDSYDKARVAEVLRAICNQVNSLSEGAGASRYQGQTVAPSATAVNLATSDITWNSNPTVVNSVVGGLDAAYVILGWIATSPGTGATATQKEIRVLTGGGTGALVPPFTDSNSLVKGSSDGTKQLRFEVDGFTGGTTRVATVQDADGTLAYINNQTFTGTCSAPTAATATNTTQLATTAFVQQEKQLTTLADRSVGTTTFCDISVAAGCREVHIHLLGVSTNGTSAYTLQLGSGGSATAAGYVTSCGSRVTEAGATNGFILHTAAVAANTFTGRVTFILEDATNNTWTSHGILTNTTSNIPQMSTGQGNVSGGLTMVRLTTAGGVNVFDAGTWSASYR